MQKIEVLGLLIFILMAVVMLTVGAALFFDWLAEPGTASAACRSNSGCSRSSGCGRRNIYHGPRGWR